MNKVMAIGAIFIGVVLLLAIATAVYAPPEDSEPMVSVEEGLRAVQPTDVGVDDLVVESEISAELDESFEKDLEGLEAELQEI